MAMRDITEYLPKSREAAISRKSLCEATGLTDRLVRELIEKARQDGAMILSADKGYYISEDLDEIEHFYRREDRRARSIHYRLKTARRILKAAGRL